MKTDLDLCYYCERTPKDILLIGETESELDALDWVVVGEANVLLCQDCREKYVDDQMADLQRLLEGPIEFPAGVTAVEHLSQLLGCRWGGIAVPV